MIREIGCQSAFLVLWLALSGCAAKGFRAQWSVQPIVVFPVTAAFSAEAYMPQKGNVEARHHITSNGRFVASHATIDYTYAIDPHCQNSGNVLRVSSSKTNDIIAYFNEGAAPETSVATTIDFPSGIDLSEGVDVWMYDDGCKPSDARITIAFTR